MSKLSETIVQSISNFLGLLKEVGVRRLALQRFFDAEKPEDQEILWEDGAPFEESTTR